jgi:hypothetical protein
MKLAVEVILARLEDIRLDPEVPVRRQGKMIVRGVENLPILFKRASA